MSDIFAMACIPFKGKPVIEHKKLDKKQAPIRTINGGRLFILQSGWQVFQAWTGSQMALIPPHDKSWSERSWKRRFCRGWWSSTGTAKCNWNKDKEFGGVRMGLKTTAKNRKALEQSGLKFFRTIKYGIDYFIEENDD